MSESERRWWVVFGLLTAAITVVGIVLIMTIGNHPAHCDPPRHWVPISCSKGCMYDCR